MDHSLLACDLTVQSIGLFIMKKPWMLFHLLVWYIMGKSKAKARIADSVMPDIVGAPVNEDVLTYLNTKKAEGAWLVLASASNEKIVRAVAARFDIFDEFFGSVPGDTFKGSAKALGLRKAYGEQGYTYVGDSISDLPVWADADVAVTVGAAETLRRRVEALGKKVVHICPN